MLYLFWPKLLVVIKSHFKLLSVIFQVVHWDRSEVDGFSKTGFLINIDYMETG